MVNFDSLNNAIQSLLGLIPLIDNHFSKWSQSLSQTPEAIAQFKTDVRTMFSSELCLLIKDESPLPIVNDTIFDSPLTIEECMAMLSVSDTE